MSIAGEKRKREEAACKKHHTYEYHDGAEQLSDENELWACYYCMRQNFRFCTRPSSLLSSGPSGPTTRPLFDIDCSSHFNEGGWVDSPPLSFTMLLWVTAKLGVDDDASPSRKAMKSILLSGAE